MASIPRQIENDDGWTDWIHPLDDRFKLACCDCGLVHNMEFRIDDLGRINFRATRNNRSTGQMRRHAIAIDAANRVMNNPANSKAAKHANGIDLTMRNKD